MCLALGGEVDRRGVSRGGRSLASVAAACGGSTARAAAAVAVAPLDALLLLHPWVLRGERGALQRTAAAHSLLGAAMSRVDARAEAQ